MKSQDVIAEIKGLIKTPSCPEGTPWKARAEDKGWVISERIAVLNPTKRNPIRLKWTTLAEVHFPDKKSADMAYTTQFHDLDSRYESKLIIEYELEMNHIVSRTTMCPKCEGDADILDFIISYDSDDRQYCSIACSKCGGRNWVGNEVGKFIFVEYESFKEDEERKKYRKYRA